MNAKLKELENSLARVYQKIYREIKKEADYPNNINAIQLKYDRLVYDNTRSAIQEAVLMANEKVNRIFKTQPYLTQHDLDLIKKNADEQTASFWRKIYLDVFRKQEQRAIVGGAEFDEEGNLLPPDDIDMNAYLLSVAIASLFGSFADATLTKTSELADTIENKPKVMWNAVMDPKTCQELSDGSEGCARRNGKIYDYDDFELQEHMPGTGTHPFCRCMLENI